MITYYKPFIILSLFDWFFGSWISAELQSQPPFNQAANWAYQAMYATIVIAGMIIADRMNRKGYAQNIFEAYPSFFAGGLLFLGYVEDLAYYALLRIWNPHEYNMPDGFLPAEISGWFGWVTGMIFGIENVIRLPLWLALFMAAIGIFFSIGFVRKIS